LLEAFGYKAEALSLFWDQGEGRNLEQCAEHAARGYLLGLFAAIVHVDQTWTAIDIRATENWLHRLFDGASTGLPDPFLFGAQLATRLLDGQHIRTDVRPFLVETREALEANDLWEHPVTDDILDILNVFLWEVDDLSAPVREIAAPREGSSFDTEELVAVVVPQLGAELKSATIVRWLKSVGETVERDEALSEITTEIVDAEIP